MHECPVKINRQKKKQLNTLKTQNFINILVLFVYLVVKKKMPLTLIENIFKESSEFPEFRNEFEEYLRTNLE